MLALVGAYLLVRHLTGSRPAAAVSGVLFAFCPFIFARTGHIQLLMTAGPPFSMLAFHRLANRPGIGRGVVLGLVLAVTALACGYYGLFAGLMVGVAILFHTVTDRLWTARAPPPRARLQVQPPTPARSSRSTPQGDGAQSGTRRSR